MRFSKRVKKGGKVVPVGGRCYSAVYAFLKAGNENEAGARAANTRGVEEEGTGQEASARQEEI